MDEPLQELFAAVREACSPRAWSRGVELARADAVDALSPVLSPVGRPGAAIELRVRVPGVTVAPAVSLQLEDGEWSCSCDGDGDACEHVAAAVLALRQAQKQGKTLAISNKAQADVGYRLRPDGDRILVGRVAVKAGAEEPIAASLAGIASGREGGPPVEATQVDLSIDAFLQQSRVKSLPAERFLLLLPLLAQARDVRWQGALVTVSAEPLWPKVSLQARGKAFALVFDKPDEWLQIAAPGLALCRGEPSALRPIGAAEIAGAKIDELPAEQRFEGAAIAELVTEVLPLWRGRTTVDERARLPEAGEAQAMPLIEVSQRGAALHVVAAIGYGRPPLARVVAERLESLSGRALPIVARNPRAEKRAAGQLAALGLSPGKAAAYRGAEAVAMAARLRDLPGQGFAILGDAHEAHYPGALSAEVGLVDGRLEISFSGVAAGQTRAVDANAVLDAWQSGLGAVPLAGGGWAPLPLDWLERYGDRVRDLLAARDARGQVAAHGRPALCALLADLDHPMPADLARMEPIARDFTGIGRAALPDDLRAELRPYQRAGVDWLCFLRDAELGALLADDMGLGKTLQALCALSGRALIVCPRSVAHNWADEIRRFRPGLRVCVYHGAERELSGAEGSTSVTLTTYGVLRRDAGALAAERWNAIVLDEAQAIKNPDSQTAQAAYRLQAPFRLALSGTPVENRLEELWSALHFCNPGLLGGRAAFRDRVERPIAAGDANARARLREKIRPFVLRRKKSEVAADLPARSEAVLHVELDADERASYDAILAATKKAVVAELDQGNVLGALTALLRLRQAACDVALVPGCARAEASSKVQQLVFALEEAAADGHRALVFSQWTSLLDRVEPELRAAGIGFCRLDGSTRDRAQVVREFQEPNGPPAMLLSLKAGGVGLNLHAADHVFLLDPWWNPAAEDQAADRAHRIGQTRPVIIYRLVAKDTVEERILALQADKRALAQAALEDASAASALTREDLLALIA